MQGVTSADWSYTEYAKLPGSVRDDAEGLEKAAKHFESLFINMWLKSAREANAALAKDSFFSSNEMEMQQQMFDSQMAMHLAREGGIGLAPTIVRQLSGRAAAKPVEQGDAPGKLERTVINRPPPAPEPVVEARQVEPARLERRIFESAGDNKVVEPDGTSPAGLSAEATSSGSRATRFDDPESFVRTLAPRIKAIAGAAGLPPLAVMAQAALETGWGKSVIQDAQGESSHNLFGIKDTNWSGPSVEIHSKEFLLGSWQDKRAGFRAYPDWDAGIADYVRTITGSSRYAPENSTTTQHGNSDPVEYADRLQRAGYATDPNYAQKLKGIMQRLVGLGF